MTRRHKSPKSSVFAIKSTEHPSLFENAADYLHVFSCNPKDGEQWMQAILVARVSRLDAFLFDSKSLICPSRTSSSRNAMCSLPKLGNHTPKRNHLPVPEPGNNLYPALRNFSSMYYLPSARHRPPISPLSLAPSWLNEKQMHNRKASCLFVRLSPYMYR